MRAVFFKIKDAGACHPLMELCHHGVVNTDAPVHEALYHLAGGETEHHRLDIVPLSLY